MNLIGTLKRERSCKPDEFYDAIEACSPGSRLELFAWEAEGVDGLGKAGGGLLNRGGDVRA